MAKIAKEIHLETPNTPGTVAKVSAAIKEAGVNIRGLCAWGEGDKGNFMIVTEDNAKAIESLTKAGFQAQESDVVLLDLKNQVGTLAEAAQKLGTAGVNVNYCYVSTVGSDCLAVLSTGDNAKAVEVL